MVPGKTVPGIKKRKRCKSLYPQTNATDSTNPDVRTSATQSRKARCHCTLLVVCECFRGAQPAPNRHENHPNSREGTLYGQIARSRKRKCPIHMRHDVFSSRRSEPDG